MADQELVQQPLKSDEDDHEQAIVSDNQLQPNDEAPTKQHPQKQKNNNSNYVYYWREKLNETYPFCGIRSCCGCSQWFAIHLFLVYLLLSYLTTIAFASYALVVLQSDDGEYLICPDKDSPPSDCEDIKKFYENHGLTEEFAICTIAFSCFGFLVSCLTFYGLYTCKSWIFLVEYITMNVHVIFLMVFSIVSGHYFGFFSILLPILFSCYFWMFYVLAKYYESGGYNHTGLSLEPQSHTVLVITDPAMLEPKHPANVDIKERIADNYTLLFRMKMRENDRMCCCTCNNWCVTMFFIAYIMIQNILIIVSASYAIVAFTDDSGEWDDLKDEYNDNGLGLGFGIFWLCLGVIGVLVNCACIWGLYKCSPMAILAQCIMCGLDFIFLIVYSIMSSYYYGFFTILLPMLFGFHFWTVYVIAKYFKNGGKYFIVEAVYRR